MPRKSKKPAPPVKSSVEIIDDEITSICTSAAASPTGPEVHKFWDTQPVLQLGTKVADAGSLRTWNEQHRPFSRDAVELPSSLEWCEVDIADDEDLAAVHQLLAEHYVEDSAGFSRLQYSPEFLRWALTPPGYYRNWMFAIRRKVPAQAAAPDGTVPEVAATIAPKVALKPLAFVSAVPVTLRLGDKTIKMGMVNFLCIHKILRSTDLAPKLIKECHRRISYSDTYLGKQQPLYWHALYTVSRAITQPFARSQYYHRHIDVQRLVDVGFMRLPEGTSVKPYERQFALPKQPETEGLRPMEERDVGAVAGLLAKQLSKFKVAMSFSEADVEHMLMPRAGVVHSYVVEQADGAVTDFVSFYSLPMRILAKASEAPLLTAYLYYYAAGRTRLKDLVQDALVLAKQLGHAVMHMMNVMDNGTFASELEFHEGGGYLWYYIFNYRFPLIGPEDVGLLLL